MITYICMLILAEKAVRLASVQHINPPLSGGSDHCLFPQLFAQPFSVLTALTAHKDVCPPDFQALKKGQLAEELCFAAKRPESDGQL